MMLPILFLLFLVTALGSVILYLRTAHDIFGILAVGNGLVCLIWGLVISHWSVHLLALIALLSLGSSSSLMRVPSNNKRAV
jgi:hypothetical protein